MNKKSFWKKRIKNTYTLAEYLQEDENKIKELKNGEREIEGKTLDKVLDAIEKEKVNGNIKNVEILQWYKDTDLKKLREKFGYKSQADLASELGCNNSTICNFEKKKEGFVKTVSPRLKQLYYFFNNDFNRKTKNEVIDVVDKVKVSEDINKGKIILWYNKTSIKGYRICDGKTLKERGEEIGIPPTSLKDLEDKRTKRFGENMVKVYNFYKDRNESNKLEDEKIWDWYLNTDIRALREKEGIKQTGLAKKLGLSQPSVGEVENHKTKSISSTLRILYSYYKNNNDEVGEEKLDVPDVKVVVDKESKILQPIEKIEEEKTIPDSDIIRMKDLEIEHLRRLNEELKIQIKRYEKLIDRL